MNNIPAGTTPEISSNQSDKSVNRACEACRSLKVRCLADPSSSTGKCRRCSKAGRTCYYAAPQKRKRRKRTDTRVAELEKEVRALRSLLSKGERPGPEQILEEDEGKTLEVETGFSKLGSKSDEDEDSSDQDDEDINPMVDPANAQNDPCQAPMNMSMGGMWVKEGKSMDLQACRDASEIIYSCLDRWDVIDQGIITMETAAELFDFYCIDLSLHLPMVVFGPAETAINIRREKPTLFLCIITASAGRFNTKLYNRLHKEVLKVLAQRLIILGDKTVELVQAQLITAFWLYPPNDFKKLKFYEYMQMAGVMALDIGIGAPGSERRVRVSSDHRGPPGGLELERRRTFLACYLLCASVSMALRRPSTLRFTHWTSECLDFVENCESAALYDPRLCAWVKLQAIADECGASLGFDDPTYKSTLSELWTQLTLKRFKLRLSEWKESLPPGVMNASLKIQYHQTNIFLHEYAMLETDPEDQIPSILLKDKDQKPTPVSPSAISAIATVVESAHTVLDTFTSMEARDLRVFPIIAWSRMAYCVVLLIKISVSAASPTSELSKLLDIESLKVDFYIKKLVTIIKEAVGPQKARIPSKFLKIVAKFGIWYHQRQSQLRPRIVEGVQKLMKPLHNLAIYNKEIGDGHELQHPTAPSCPPVSGSISQAASTPFMSQPTWGVNSNSALNYDISTPAGVNNTSTSDPLDPEQALDFNQNSSSVFFTDNDVDFLSMINDPEYAGADDLNLWFPAEVMNFEYTGQKSDFDFHY